MLCSPGKTYEEQLKDLGFKPAGICNCAGGRTLKFKKDNYTVYMNRGNRIFRIKQGKNVVVTFTPLPKLISSLNKLLDVAVEEKV